MKSLTRQELVKEISKANNKLNSIYNMVGDGLIHTSILDDIKYYEWTIKHHARLLVEKYS